MLRGPDARLRLITALLIAVLLPVVVQLVRLQVLEHSRYETEVEGLVRRQYSLPEPPWGVILDRNSDLLVGNVPVFDIGAEVNLVTDTVMAATTLAPLLNRSETELLQDLTLSTGADGASFSDSVVWRPLARNVPMATVEKLKSLDWIWMTMTPTWERYYAEGALASHILGFVNQEGVGYGIHAFQMRFLRGESVSRKGYVSGDEQPMPDEMITEMSLPYRGTDLRLTIDRTIQAYIEGELEYALQEYNAPSGTIIVMNPQNGEILAIASRPHYEPSRYSEYAQAEQTFLFQDPAVSVSYEPGSVFKVVTVAAAVDSGRVDQNWSYYDGGTLEYGGVIVHNWSGGGYGTQNLEGVLAHSLNVGVATLSTQVLGPEIFYQYLRAFGFGQDTGIEVAGEANGTLHLPTDWDWSDSFLATNAFGQGIAVTSLQMMAAVGAIANEGEMMQPHVVAERLYADGRCVEIPARSLGYPISKESAQFVTTLMERVVERELELAQVPGYRVAGKTGTAQIPTTGGYDPEDVIASFIGFGPLPDPQILILIKLDRPDVPEAIRWGSQTAAAVFQRVASRLFVLLGIPPTEVASHF
ncbi:MAG: penicillin-binding protein 2 [Anaerolineae bacterium]|nr:penicillin-binding protein 2 [Anaerolineae bacterium]